MKTSARPPSNALALRLQHFYAVENALLEVALHEPAAGARSIPEAFVQDLWRGQRFDHAGLQTSRGTSVSVLDPGVPNPDAGPDFLRARIRIGDVAWVGDVEIHVASGEWFWHQHHLDARYNSVVLHVALHADIWTGGLPRADGTILPELILFPYLEGPLRTLLHQFYTRPKEDLLCAQRWPAVPDDLKRSWMEEMAYERLKEREQQLAHPENTAESLEALLHQRLFAALGYAKNDTPMETLARRLPLSLVRRFEDPFDLEALHFGVAGLLPTPADLLETDRATADYAMLLRDRFERLSHRLSLPVMERSAWQFFRLRPANFPPARIAQAVALLVPGGLLHHNPVGRLDQALHTAHPLQALRDLLRVSPSSFWTNHVRLDKATRPRQATLGRQRTDVLIVNAVVPVMSGHAALQQDDARTSLLRALLRELPPENNEITRRFAALGTEPAHAWETQGLHQLFQTRCSQARCLSCAIGKHLLERP